jgi:HSP20 family molecular chaperone IbpA
MDQQELKVQPKRVVETRQESTTPAHAFIPLTDIYETEDALTVMMEVPGIRRDDVDVKVENDILTIEARIDYGKYKGLQPVYTEYNIGNYVRSFELSGKIDRDRISADLKDGVMTLVLPKAEAAKARKISVS